MALNNNQVAAVVNAAVAQATGSELQNLNLQNIIDTGNDPSIIGTKENFTKSLCNVIVKNWFTDTAYRSSYNDPWFVDAEEFGAIVQSISIEYPQAQPSHAWNDFETKITKVGQYDVYIPVVNSQLFGKSISWEIAITVTDEQWDTAFRNASELATFVSYIHMCVDNAIVMHLEELDFANRNNFMAEKIAYANAHVGEGIHVVNLVKLYHDEKDASITTKKAFMDSEKCLRFAPTKINEISTYFTKPSEVFNTAARKDTFTPKDRQVLQVLTYFENQINSVAMANTFHEEFIKMPGYESVPYWQGSGKNYSFDDVSTIDITIDSNGSAIKKSGIVAFLADKWAIMHTIKKRRTAAKVFEPEGLTNYYNQFRDQYMNNLKMNAVVFTVEDIE